MYSKDAAWQALADVGHGGLRNWAYLLYDYNSSNTHIVIVMMTIVFTVWIDMFCCIEWK